MAWTYDATDLDTTTASGRLNVVRFLIGDTDSTDEKVQDEEITFALAQNSDNVYNAGAWLCYSLAAKYAGMASVELDGQLAVQYSDLYANYSALTKSLEAQSKKYGSNLGIAAGGISATEVETVRSNSDRLSPSFRRDRFTNPQNTDEYDNQDTFY